MKNDKSVREFNNLMKQYALFYRQISENKNEDLFSRCHIDTLALKLKELETFNQSHGLNRGSILEDASNYLLRVEGAFKRTQDELNDLDINYSLPQDNDNEGAEHAA